VDVTSATRSTISAPPVTSPCARSRMRAVVVCKPRLEAEQLGDGLAGYSKAAVSHRHLRSFRYVRAAASTGGLEKIGPSIVGSGLGSCKRVH
jgi:hypothetical protein